LDKADYNYNPDNQRVVKGGRAGTTRTVERLIASLRQEAPSSIRWSSSITISPNISFSLVHPILISPAYYLDQIISIFSFECELP